MISIGIGGAANVDTPNLPRPVTIIIMISIGIGGAANVNTPNLPRPVL